MVLQHKDSSTLPKNTSESIPLIECDWGDVFKGKKKRKGGGEADRPINNYSNGRLAECFSSACSKRF